MVKDISCDATKSFKKGKTSEMKTQRQSKTEVNSREDGYKANDSSSPEGRCDGRARFNAAKQPQVISRSEWARLLNGLKSQIHQGYGVDGVLKDHFC
jgi:hypothetical protein